MAILKNNSLRHIKFVDNFSFQFKMALSMIQEELKLITIPVIKQKILEYFKDKPVTKVYLFGSYADGRATSKSDIDILVELDYTKNIGLRFYRWIDELENIFRKKVDMETLDFAPLYFINNVKKQMILLYEREKIN